MQIAQLLSGFSLGEADLLRRAMGKKIKSEMSAQRERFVSGAVANNVPANKAKAIFEQVDKFAGYGFNKSHAAAYALVAYQTAYLKANYPTEFMAALMTLEQGNTEKLGGLHQELIRLGIKLHPPDINHSVADFSVEYSKDDDCEVGIRYSLAAIRNVGVTAVNAIVKERAVNGPFQNLFDFAKRLDTADTNRRQLLNLAKAGAFDALNPNRAQVAKASDLLVRHTMLAASERGGGQKNLFGDVDEGSHIPPLPVTEDWPAFERLRKEADALGFYLSAHPLDAFGESLKQFGLISYAEVVAKSESLGSERVRLGVVVQRRRDRTSARGRYAFLEVSDQSAIFEVTVFTELFNRVRDIIEVGSLLLIEASVQREEDSIRIVAQTISNLEEQEARKTRGFRVYLGTEARLETLRAVMAREKEGVGRVALVQPLEDDLEVEVELPGRYEATPSLRSALKSVPGVVEVTDI